jgi:hypothetical protein
MIHQEKICILRFTENKMLLLLRYFFRLYPLSSVISNIEIV